MPKGVRIALIIIAVLIVVVAALPFFFDANTLRPTLESRLSVALGRKVTVGDLRVSLFSGGVSAQNLAVADDPAFSREPFVQAKSLKISAKMLPLIFSRKLIVTGLTIDQPQVVLLQSSSGAWNYSSLGGQPAAGAQPPQGGAAPQPPGQSQPAPASQSSGLYFSVSRLRITNGRFSIGDVGPRAKPTTLENVDLEVRDFAPGASFPFSLSAEVAGGGQIKLDGAAGPINSANVDLTPLKVKLDVARLNLASAFAGTVPGLAGTASLQGSAESQGKLSASGRLTAENLKMAANGAPARRPVSFDFALSNDLRTHAGALQRGAVQVGQAKANLHGTYAMQAGVTVLDMRFAGSKMPIPDLESLLPALGISLPSGSKLDGGTADANFVVKGPLSGFTADGSAALANTQLTGFDLGRKLAVIQTLAGIKSTPNTQIQELSLKMRMTPAGIVVETIRLVAPALGELNGAGTVNSKDELNFRMAARVNATGMAAALSRSAIPFFIQGTAKDPVFKPDIQGLAQSQAGQFLQSEQGQKLLKGRAGKAAGEILNNIFGGKKK